jgi:acetylornithine deacetylase/succinyl-diaminopimelate desuccinylase-like protein
MISNRYREPRAGVRFGLIALMAPLVLVPSAPARAEFPSGLDDRCLHAAAAASVPDYLDFLSLPNDSTSAADIRKNAAWLEAAFRKRGFTTRLLPNDGRPLVFAETSGGGAERKTILFYMHFDGQPVIPSQWSQKDPWRPVVKRRGPDGTWTEVDRAELLRPDFDPELRVFARSSSDDKGPIAMFLAALDVLQLRRIAPAVGVKVLLDSQEEVNSPGIAAVVGAHTELLRADALVILDGPLHATGRPTVVFGNRGIVTVTLTVYGPRAPLHSGHYGNYVPNPAQCLARLLAGMKDDDGRVTIPGYYSRTKLTDAERTLLAGTPDDEAALLKRVGIAAPDKVGANYQESLQYPSLNVRGLAAGGTGEKAANIVPEKAVAELDLRTTVESDADFLLGLLRSYVESQGFRLVNGEPTDDERALYPKLAQMKPGLPEKAARQPVDSTIGGWVSAALAEAWAGAGPAASPVRIRIMGGTVPTATIVAPLRAPFVIVPLVNPDNNQHTYDENMRMGHYVNGIRTILGLLTTPYPD